jgi:hypothetical protein
MRLVEAEQQAEMQAGGFQIIQALRAINLVDRPFACSACFAVPFSLLTVGTTFPGR